MSRSDVLKAAAGKRIAAAKRLLTVAKPSLDQLQDAVTNLLTATRQQGEVIAIAESAPPVTSPDISVIDVGPIPDFPASDKRQSAVVFAEWAAAWKQARFPGQNATADQWLEAATPEEERALAGAGLFTNPIDVGVSTGQAIDWSSFSALIQKDEIAYVFIHGEKVGEVRVNSLPAGPQRVTDWAKSLGLDIGV